MSNHFKDNSFQTTPWQARNPKSADGPTLFRMPGKAAERAGFETIVKAKTTANDSQEFVSPYVSPEKLKQLNASVRKQQEANEPDPEEISRQAFEKGFAQGEAAGMAAGHQRAKEIIGQIQNILSEVEVLWQRLVENHEKQMMDLICRVAEKVVFGQVEIDHDIVRRAILNAFSVIPEPIGVTIELNPKDYEYIETIKEDFFTHIASLKDVSVIASPSVSKGGCIVSTRGGEVDTSLESRLDAVRRSIVDANGKRANGRIR